jgi:hypothetical protein
MSEKVVAASSTRCYQGEAIPNTTECPDDLANYHPPKDEGAREYITRFCEGDSGSSEFTLEGLSGWKKASRDLMKSLTFTAITDDEGKVYYEAPGNLQEIAGYKFKGWRIDTEEDDQNITFIDVLTWVDSEDADVRTKWIWVHKK